MPVCRCSALYQWKKRWQNARASSRQPNRSGKSGRYFRVRNWGLAVRIVVGRVRPGMGLGHAQVGEQERHRLGLCRLENWVRPRDLLFRGGAGPRMEAMSASLVYVLLRQILQMLTQLARDGGACRRPSRPMSASMIAMRRAKKSAKAERTLRYAASMSTVPTVLAVSTSS
jgi:hypothetical protein